MISIIVSSYNDKFFEAFTKNVQHTIGNMQHEIVRIYNPGSMGICKAYNEGAKKAVFDYLVFAHEDILFHTQHWGQVLIDTFKSDPNIGLVGVTGTFYKSWIYSGWNLIEPGSGSIYMIQSANSNSMYLNVKKGVTDIVHLKSDQLAKLISNRMEDQMYYESVAAIDGLFMATTREVYKKHQFDEVNIPDFHCYDLDFSLQVFKSHKVVVTHNILVEHFSSGNFNLKWFDSTASLHNKWKDELPTSTGVLTKKEILKMEKCAFGIFLSTARQRGYGLKMLANQVYSKQFLQLLGITDWIYFQFFIIKRFFSFLVKK